MIIKSITLNHYSVGSNHKFTSIIAEKKTSTLLGIVQCLDGLYNFSYTSGETTTICDKGCLIVEPKKSHKYSHDISEKTGMRVSHWVYLDIFVNGKYSFDDIFDFPNLIPTEYNSQIYDIINFLRIQPETPEILCQKMINCYKLIKILISISKEKETLDNNILNVMNHMKKNYNNRFTIEELAAMANMSTSNFYLSFKRQSGKSPIAFLNSYRLVIAASLLEQTTHPISEVASSTGFDNQFYFSKLFKKKYELSPYKYRKAYNTN